MSAGEPFDVAVIGGGVVGCAVARRFALDGALVVLLERGEDILSGASKANSALLHTGFDAPPDSLELAMMQDGYRQYMASFEADVPSFYRPEGPVPTWERLKSAWRGYWHPREKRH